MISQLQPSSVIMGAFYSTNKHALERVVKKKEHALERATFIIAWFVELLPAAVGSALGSPGKVHPSFGLVRCEEFLPRKSASASRIGFGLGKSNSTSLQFKLQNLWHLK